MRFTLLALVVTIAGCQCDDLVALPGTLPGRACDPDAGAPLGAAEVVLSSHKGTVTDARGRFTTRVAAGTYDVTVRTDDVERTFTDVSVKSGASTTVDDDACRDLPA